MLGWNNNFFFSLTTGMSFPHSCFTFAIVLPHSLVHSTEKKKKSKLNIMYHTILLHSRSVLRHHHYSTLSYSQRCGIYETDFWTQRKPTTRIYICYVYVVEIIYVLYFAKAVGYIYIGNIKLNITECP